MSRIPAAAVSAAVLAVVLGAGLCQGAQLMTRDEALASVLGKDMEITVEMQTPTAEELAAIEEAMERPLFTEEDKLAWGCPVEPVGETEAQPGEAPEVEPTEGAEAAPEKTAPAEPVEVSEEQAGGAADVGEEGEGEVPEVPEGIAFYFGSKDGKKQDVAVFVEALGKWGPVGYAVGMNLDGVVRRVEVVESQEKRGRDVERRSFMKQFEGKSSKDKLEVTEDIMPVSGATVTSRSACDAVMKAAVLYAEFYLNGVGAGAASPEGD